MNNHSRHIYSLTSLQKKIVIVISLILNCLAACYLINRCIKNWNVAAKERFLTSSKIVDLANQRFENHRLKDKILDRIQYALRVKQGEEMVKNVILGGGNMLNLSRDDKMAFDHALEFFKNLIFFKNLKTRMLVEE